MITVTNPVTTITEFVTVHNSVSKCGTYNNIDYTVQIKLCPRGAKICALPLFCDRDLEINPHGLKLDDDIDILKMYPHTENEAASLRHSFKT